MAGCHPSYIGDIIHLNVGGTRFSTSRQTLTWIPDSFFTALLSGRIPSLRDETGAIFIDRDPKNFSVILNYLRTRDIDLQKTDLRVLRQEAEYYGIAPLVKRLMLCEDIAQSSCGDVLFYGLLPAPSIPVQEPSLDNATTKSNNSNGWLPESNSNYVTPNPPSNSPTSTPIFSGESMMAIQPTTHHVHGHQRPGNGHFRNSSLDLRIASSGSAVPRGPSDLRNISSRGVVSGHSRTASLDLRHTRNSSADLNKYIRNEIGLVLTTHHPGSWTDPLRVRIIKAHHNWIAVAYAHFVTCFRLKDSSGWQHVFTSPHIENCIEHIAINAKMGQAGSGDIASKMVAISCSSQVHLWGITDEGGRTNVGTFNLNACGSITGFITNDYQKKISFLSTRLPVDSNVSCLLKQAAIRSLSCEVVPGREGQIYFGDSVCGHVLSNTFFLKDAQARGFHRWYSILVFMKDKHFLLNSWNFFQKCINEIVLTLKGQTVQVYSNEQNAHSQRAFRLSSFDQKPSTARSLVKLTASTKVFPQLHLWFTWLLSVSVKRLEEHFPAQVQDCKLGGAGNFTAEINKNQAETDEGCIYHLRRLRRIFRANDFQRVLYSTLIGQQVVVRGPKPIVENIIQQLRLFLPAEKVRCQEFGYSYKTADVCNLIGLDLCAAVPMSTDTIMRLDVVPFQEVESITNQHEEYSFCKFIVRNECKLPDKLPSLLIKIDKVLTDESLTDNIALLRIKCLMEQWLHVAEVIREVKKRNIDVHILTSLTQSLGIQEQDYPMINFWTS